MWESRHDPDAPVSIYGLIDPRDGQLRYISSSGDVTSRVRAHGYNNYGSQGKTEKEAWLQALKVENIKLDYEVFEQVKSKDRI